MDLTTTIIIAIAGIALFLLARWQGARERPLGKPALIPWVAVGFVALVVTILMGAHLVTLLTGTPLRGRMG